MDPLDRPSRAFTLGEINQIVASGRRNRWIAWPDVAHATLKRGIIDHSLHIQLSNGRREKFLWLMVDGGYDVLEQALGRALSERFTASDKAIG